MTELGSGKIKLQDRDLSLLRSLFESRVMTTAHVTTLHFGGRAEMAKKRLQRLRAARLIRSRQRSLFEPATLFLAKGGLDLLRERGILGEYPDFSLPSLERRSVVSESTLRHELAVMDVKASIHHAVDSANLSLLEFTTWPMLNQFTCADGKGRKVNVRPDGFLRLSGTKIGTDAAEHSFFIELDRSTEVQIKLISRAHLYVGHYRSGGFAQQNGGSRTEYRKYPFRVLYILRNTERRNNTAEHLLRCDPPILTHVWLTTFDEVTRDPFGAIWIRPIDYRDHLAGSPFDPARRPPQAEYKRQTSRDALVERTVRRRRLIES